MREHCCHSTFDTFAKKLFSIFSCALTRAGCVIFQFENVASIRSSEKFLSFYKQIMNAQHFSFYIILSNYVWSILFYQNKNHNVRRIKFHVYIKMRCCKKRVCKRKTLFGQPNTIYIFYLSYVEHNTTFVILRASKQNQFVWPPRPFEVLQIADISRI